MTLETDKSLGGVGAILLVIGTIPFAGAYTGILALVGLILVLIAMKGLSNYYKDSSIFNNALYGIIIAIVGGILFIVAVVTSAIGLLDKIGIHPSNWTDWSMLQKFDWSSVKCGHYHALRRCYLAESGHALCVRHRHSHFPEKITNQSFVKEWSRHVWHGRINDPDRSCLDNCLSRFHTPLGCHDTAGGCILLDQNSACAANCTRTHTNPRLNKLLTHFFPNFLNATYVCVSL